MSILSKEEEEKIRKGYKEMEDYISSRHKYYYTNPPKGVNPMTSMELFNIGILDVGDFYDNPVVMMMELNDPNLLTEAEYATYPIYNTIRYVSKALQIPISQFSIVEKSDGTETIALKTINEEDLIEDVNKAMHLCGYYEGYRKNVDKDTRFVCITYEPKFKDTVNDKVFGGKVLYHLSPLPYKDRILKNGFVPKSGNSVFKYPDRTYFFLGSMGKKEVESWVSVFKSKNKKYGDKPYCLYTIDVKKLPRNIDFYSDPNLKGAIYTMDNIAPNVIKQIDYYY